MIVNQSYDQKSKCHTTSVIETPPETEDFCETYSDYSVVELTALNAGAREPYTLFTKRKFMKFLQNRRIRCVSMSKNTYKKLKDVLFPIENYISIPFGTDCIFAFGCAILLHAKMDDDEMLLIDRKGNPLVLDMSYGFPVKPVD